MQRRKLVAYGLVSLGLASQSAQAQGAAIASITDVAGTWSGRVDPSGMKLKLTLQPDGKFDLLQTLLTEYNSSGKATIKNGTLVLPLAVGETVLKLTPEGRLTGPYVGERIKGTAILTKE